jgi:hypothetical protein
MDIQLTYDLLTATSEYRGWRKRNAQTAFILESYWLKLARGEAAVMPTISNPFAKALAGMVSLFPPVPPPVEPEPTEGLVYPTNDMSTHFERGGLAPVPAGDVWRCETTGSGLSRLHWVVQKNEGDTFALSCNLGYSADFRGVVMRLENYNADMTNLNQLELARYSDGMWYVVQALYRSSTEVYRQILSKFSIPQGARVELKGRLSTIEGGAVTELYINGALAGKTNLRNMQQPVTLSRARYGIVDTGQAGVVTVGRCAFV